MKSDIFKTTVRAELEDFDKAQLPLNPSYAPKQPDVWDLIDYYWMDKYRDGDYTKDGWKKAFYNIVCNPTLVSQKMVDLDTKDVRIIGAEGESYYPAWLFSRDMALYMRMNNFGATLNDFIFNWPKYGTFFAKKVGDKIYRVPLKNIHLMPTEEYIQDTPIIEDHSYSFAALRKMPWDSKDIELAIADAKAKKKDKVMVYERFGEDIDTAYNYIIGDDEGNILFSHKFDDVEELYRKLDWEPVPGQMFGRGQVQKLFEAQIQTNRVENFKTEGLHWSSKHLFQTRDSTFGGKNLMRNADNGEVIYANSEITPVANEERNLAAYRSEEDRWDKLIRDVTFSYAELAGERPPAGTPLGTSIIQSQQAGGYFDMRREDAGIFWKGIILDWIIPSFKDSKYEEHKLMLGEFDDMEVSKIREMFTTKESNDDIINFVIKNKRIPNVDEEGLIRSIAKDKVSRTKDLTIPRAYYENVKYKVDVIITNEQVDVAARLTTLQTALQLLASNPAIVQNPQTKRIFYKLLDLSGISPVDLGIDTDQTPDLNSGFATFLPRGGSLAKPLPTTPAVLPQTATA